MIFASHNLLRTARRFFPALLGFSVFIGVMTRVASAQPSSELPVFFRVLAKDVRIDDLRYDLKGRTVPVQTLHRQFSPRYECPPSGKLTLYRLMPAAESGKPPRPVIVAEATLQGEGPFLLVLGKDKPADAVGTLGLQVLDDSWQAHPANAIRVLSFSARPTAIKIADNTAELLPGSSYVTPPQIGASLIEFKVATRDNGQWTLRLQSPQALLPRARVTLLLLDAAPSDDDPFPVALNIASLIDTAQPPAAKPARQVSLR